MNHFALARGYIVTANEDGSIPLNAKVVAELSAADEGVHIQALIAQANLANELLETLKLFDTGCRIRSESAYAPNCQCKGCRVRSAILEAESK